MLSQHSGVSRANKPQNEMCTHSRHLLFDLKHFKSPNFTTRISYAILLLADGAVEIKRDKFLVSMYRPTGSAKDHRYEEMSCAVIFCLPLFTPFLMLLYGIAMQPIFKIRERPWSKPSVGTHWLYLSHKRTHTPNVYVHTEGTEGRAKEIITFTNKSKANHNIHQMSSTIKADLTDISQRSTDLSKTSPMAGGCLPLPGAASPQCHGSLIRRQSPCYCVNSQQECVCIYSNQRNEVFH